MLTVCPYKAIFNIVNNEQVKYRPISLTKKTKYVFKIHT